MSVDQSVLSPEESRALMDALREGEGPREAAVVEIDLAGGERPLRAAQPVIEKLGTQLASSLRRTLATTYRLSCEVLAEPGEIISFGELRHRLEPDTIVGRLEAVPTGAPVMMFLGPTFVSAVVDFGFGGSGEMSSSLGGREPTALERNLLRRLCVLIAADATQTWKRDAAIDLQFLHLEGRNDLPGAISDGTALLLVPFRLTFDTRQDEIVLALTAGSVDTLARIPVREVSGDPVKLDQGVRRRIKGWPLWVSAELGRCTVTINELLGLSRGSVLRLDSSAHEPVEILINGVPKMLGRPVISHGSLAAQVERWLDHKTTEERDGDRDEQR